MVNFLRGRSLSDHFFDVRRGPEHFAHRRSTHVARILAVLTAAGRVNIFCNFSSRFDVRIRIGGVKQDFAMRTEFANQALRDDAKQTRREELRLDTENEQRFAGSRRCPGVGCGKNELAAVGRSHHDVGGGGITDFADHQHVGRLS